MKVTELERLDQTSIRNGCTVAHLARGGNGGGSMCACDQDEGHMFWQYINASFATF